MRKLVTSLLLIALIVSMLIGCGSEEPLITSSEDTAIYAYGGQPVAHMDPSLSSDNGNLVHANVYETLLKYDGKGDDFEYVLAEEYSANEDATTWTFKLREGVTFHDGTPFTAEAVKYSVERTKAMGGEASHIWDPVSEVVVISDYEVRFELAYPALLNSIVSAPHGAFMMSPSIEDAGGSEWLEKGNAIGTGPYALEKYDSSSEIILTQYDAYWKGWEGDHFKTVVLRSVPDQTSRKEMVESGVVDITTDLSMSDIDPLKATELIKVKSSKTLENYYVFLNTQSEYLSNKTVRQALSYAFPYEEVIEDLWFGYVSQANGILPSSQWGHEDELFQYEHNIDKAREILKEEGHEGGYTLVCTYDNSEEINQAMAELFAAQVRRLGIDVELKGMSGQEQLAMAMDPDPSKRQDMYLTSWRPDYSIPDQWFQSFIVNDETGLGNLSYYSNPRFEKLVEGAARISTTDIEKAETLYADIQVPIIDVAMTISVLEKRTIWVMNKTFKGLETNAHYQNVIDFYDTYRDLQ